MKKINLFIAYLASFIYMEFMYKLITHSKVFQLSTVNALIFLLVFSLFISIISRLCKEKINKIIYIVLMVLISVWFSAVYIVNSYFDLTLSLDTLLVADQTLSFLPKVLMEILKRFWAILIFFAPLVITLIFNKKISFKKIRLKNAMFSIVICIIFSVIYIFSLNIGRYSTYSVYNLFYKINDISLTIDKLGILNTFAIDLKRVVLGFDEEIVLNSNLNDIPDETIYEYNNLDIDFEKLMSKEKNENILKIHEYMNNDTGTLKNEYTGIFKDKNLIFILAESFNEIAVNEKLTPTLYKLVNSGFVFENFYSPSIYSTIGGEFQELTTLYASNSNILSSFRKGNVSFPQGIGNMFNALGYKTFAYHNNTYSFQDRNKYFKSVGLDNYKACGNGLEKLINCKIWPQSDLEMMDTTMTDYINEDRFMAYYVSVSGHSSYNWYNYMAVKNREEYLASGFNYSMGPASYLSAQMELDKALKLMIDELDNKGILSDTVIVLVGDHYPYELTIDEINEISDYKRDGVVEVNHSNLVIWNSEMDTVKVDKVGSQLDVMPTVYNLFGIDYDSRLMIGKDILSTESGLAIFGNRSWVSDLGTYYSHTNLFVPKEGVNVPNTYVDSINQVVTNKIVVSKLIVENNYYKKVFK